MIVKRVWKDFYNCCYCTGYYLFGIIPIYIKKDNF